MKTQTTLDGQIMEESLEQEKTKRLITTVGENKQKVTRKVDSYEYESLAECIRSDQVPASEVAEIFTDKVYYKWYKEKYLNS